MKKTLSLALAGVLSLGFFGCTSVEVSHKFNSMTIAETRSAPVAHVNAKITGFFLFCCIPIFCGSANDYGKTAAFSDTVTVDNLVLILTKNARGEGGNRLSNLQTSTSSFGCLLFSWREVQGSCTTVK